MNENEINEINNKNKDDYIVPAMKRFSDNKIPQERTFASERKYEKEFPKSRQTKVKAKKKKQTIVTTFILGLATISSVIIAPENINNSNIIDEYQIMAYDNGIVYYFDFAEDVDYSGLEVVVYNDFVRFNNSVEEEYTEGHVEDLKPNLQYVVSVTNKGKTVFKQNIITKEDKSRG